MIKNYSLLADRLKGIKLGGEELTPEKLIEAVKAENELEVEVSKMNLFTDEQVEMLGGNKKKEGYEEGKLAGSEMTVKDLKKRFGIEKEGKTADLLYNHIIEKILFDAKIEPEKKVKELQESLTSLQNKYQSDSEQWKSTIEQKDNEVKAIKTETLLLQSLPKVEGYKTNHILAAFKSDGYGVLVDEQNKVIPTLNDKPIKDAVENPEDLSKVINSWLSTSGYVKGSEGRGGSNDNGGSFSEFKTLSDVMKYMEKNKINPTERQGEEILKKFYESQK